MKPVNKKWQKQIASVVKLAILLSIGCFGIVAQADTHTVTDADNIVNESEMDTGSESTGEEVTGTNSLQTALTLGSGIAINSAGASISTQTSFRGGISTDQVNYLNYVSLPPASNPTVQGRITVDPADVGKQADLLYVAGFENQVPFDGGADTTYFTIDDTGSLSALDLYNQPNVWMAQLAAKPFKRNVTLQAEMLMDSVSAGQLNTNPSVNYYFMGYRLQDGTLIYTSMPIIAKVQSNTTTNTDTVAISANTAKVFAFNDLGMHCMDREYSVFSILPPYNVVNAQVVRPGQNNVVDLLNSNQVELRYSPIADKQGSINSTSVRKTDFWQHANALFGVNLPEGQGLKGLYMPADNPTAPGEQLFSYDAQADWFSAAGIPITPTDDAGQNNPYPLLRVSAYDKQTNTLLGSTDVVVPVAKETDCQVCHVTGKVGAQRTDVTWATDSDLEVQAKKNILLLHDKDKKTNLINSTPVLCASCHYSPALDLDKKGAQGVQQQVPTLSQVMHKYHGELKDAAGQLVFPTDAPIEQSCYQCHPGKTTQCQRDVMRNAGIQCYECHGNLTAVAGTHPLQTGGSLEGSADGKARRSWTDLPRCQSCHTGDATNHLSDSNMVVNPADGFRLRQAYRTGDLAASPILAANKRFAENNNTLFRNSKGHGGVACEACHGSTHATWETINPEGNDNIAAQQLQGHRGTIIECGTCHAGTLALATTGPHGMHNVNDARWVDGGHRTYYRRSADECKACHGSQLQGTALSKVAVARTWNVEGASIKLQAGDTVGCNLCHRNPL